LGFLERKELCPKQLCHYFHTSLVADHLLLRVPSVNAGFLFLVWDGVKGKCELPWFPGLTRKRHEEQPGVQNPAWSPLGWDRETRAGPGQHGQEIISRTQHHTGGIQLGP